MKSGIIGIVDGEISNLSSFHNSADQDGGELDYSIQVTNTDHTGNGKKVITGQAATQKVVEEESVRIDPDSGDIVVQEEPVKKGIYTPFLIVPDEFVVVQGSGGTFVFDIFSHQYNIGGVSRATIDLNEYADRYYAAESVDPWQVGFYGNIGNAEKGIVYGENVFSDQEIGDVIERSQLSQIGLQYEEGGHIIKMSITESGFVEIYQPSNYEAADFAEFVLENVIEFAE